MTTPTENSRWWRVIEPALVAQILEATASLSREVIASGDQERQKNFDAVEHLHGVLHVIADIADGRQHWLHASHTEETSAATAIVTAMGGTVERELTFVRFNPPPNLRLVRP
jgi:hypothetical protein